MRRGATGLLAALLLASLCLAGCTMKAGRFVPHSQFVYPNSNVKILGPVHAKKTKAMILIPPKFGIKDLKKVYNKALLTHSGANILTNFSEDTSLTTIPLGYFHLYIMSYEIRGDAAQMVVGEQELR